jgi:cytochrome c2
MRTVTRIRVAICLMMLACTGMLSVPLAAHAEGDAAAGEKIFAHCAPCHSTKPGETKSGRRWPASWAARAEQNPALAIPRQSRD